MRGRLSLAALAVLGAVGLGQAAVATAPTKAGPMLNVSRAEQRRRQIGALMSAAVYHRRGPGWTQAHVKRMATKKRNQARNRRAHRG